ncbi:MAG: translation initiation factor IF-2 [Candidatus Paceibacterota bacterium]
MSTNNQKNLISRPPVVVIMGHIDHGKSTLLDYIRKTKVVAGEAGGITQHVGAYQAVYTSADGKVNPITFLDTPGHAAFCNIRERGAQAADIAILIVSAEDGVKPQTIEAHKNIKDSKIPYIVAITKIDKPNANVDKAKQSLGENEIYVEGWGGDVPCLAISAITGEGIPELLEMVLLVAELAVLKTDPTLDASGVVIESTLDTRKGISATLLIKDGTLSEGSFVVADGSYAPVRFIEDFKGDKIKSGTASMPVRILGWNTIPQCGALFTTTTCKKEAEKITEKFKDEQKDFINAFNLEQKKIDSAAKASCPIPTTTEDENKVETVVLPIIVKADVIGSLEGVKHELAKIKHDKVIIKIISEGIGDINENDVKMAQGNPETILVGFNIKPDKKTSALIDRAAVPIKVKTFNIIYELSKFIDDAVVAKIPKEYVEEVSGCAKILALFSKDKERQVVGGKVESGTMNNGNDVRLMRRGTEIGRGKIKELQSKKIKVSEVAEGFEFGMMVEAKIEIAPGDRVEAVKVVEKKTN